MADIHVGDTALRLKCITTADLTEVDTALIKYFDPSGVSGSFPGTVDIPATDGFIYYDIQSPNDLYKPGTWRFWAYVTLNNGSSTAGDTFEINIKSQGK